MCRTLSGDVTCAKETPAYNVYPQCQLYLYIYTLAFRAMENGHSWPIVACFGITKIFASCHGLFHKIGRSKPLAHITKAKVIDFM